jgi:predicted esterase
MKFLKIIDDEAN